MLTSQDIILKAAKGGHLASVKRSTDPNTNVLRTRMMLPLLLWTEPFLRQWLIYLSERCGAPQTIFFIDLSASTNLVSVFRGGKADLQRSSYRSAYPIVSLQEILPLVFESLTFKDSVVVRQWYRRYASAALGVLLCPLSVGVVVEIVHIMMAFCGWRSTGCRSRSSFSVRSEVFV